MKINKVKLYVLLFVSFLSSSVYSNSDSLRLIKLFDSLASFTNNVQINNTLLLAKKEASKNALLSDQFNYLSAKFYFSIGLLDSAILICKQSLKDTLTNTYALKHAKYYNIIASIYAFKSNNKEAIDYFQKAIKILEQNQKFQLAGQINNNIANIFFSIFDYQQAYKYSKRSVYLLKETNDTMYLPAVLAVNAVSALKVDSIDLGKKILATSKLLSQKYKNTLGFLLSNYGYGELYSQSHQYDSANIYYNLSLQLSQERNIKFYQLINHLGLADLNTKTGNPKLTINNGIQAIKLLKELQNENASYSVLTSLSSAYRQINKIDSAFYYLNMAHILLKQIGSFENKKVLNELLVKYETSKKEKDLVLAQNKILNAQNKIAQNRFYIALLVFTVTVLALTFLVTYYYQKRKTSNLKSEQQRQLYLGSLVAEENERERISNELHDGVLSHLSAIRLKLHENTTVDKDLITIQNDIRTIAHNLFPVSFNKMSLAEAINQFCLENSSTSLKIEFYANSQVMLDVVISKTLYLIVQELVQNVIKHAKAKNCFINLVFDANELMISVEDDGVGLKSNITEMGQGLNSIKKRIAILNGNFDISSEMEKGTLCLIKLKI